MHYNEMMSVCVSVWLFHNNSKTAAPIEMVFGIEMANVSELNIRCIAFVRFDILLRFKMVSTIVTALHISLNGFNCLIQYIRKILGFI